MAEKSRIKPERTETETDAAVARKKAPAETMKPSVSTQPETPASKKVAVPAKPKKPKTSLKRKTFKSSKVVKSAIERIEKTVEDSAPSPLQEALDRLRGEAQARGITRKRVAQALADARQEVRREHKAKPQAG